MSAIRPKPCRTQRLLTAAVACAALLPSVAFGYSFKPTSLEWATWPDYCKARYVNTLIGRKSEYQSAVPPAIIKNWEARLGTVTFTHVHHYCASLVYVQRSSSAQSSRDRKYLLLRAERDAQYTLQRIPPSSPLYPEVARHLQLVQALRRAAG